MRDRPPTLDDVRERVPELQRLVPGAVRVGELAALHAPHRRSFDDDHVRADRFDTILENLEALGEWSLARAQPDKLILGELGEIETGIRQLFRQRPRETEQVEVRGKTLVVPTADTPSLGCRSPTSPHRTHSAKGTPMHHRYFYKPVDGPCWGPLERVAELTIVSADLPVIDPGHFMYTARLEAPGRPDLNLYKHFYTRCYLNLDDDGHAHVYVGPGRRRKGAPPLSDAGLYEPLPDLLMALERLDLGFLDENAWMTDHDRESLARLVARKQREGRAAASTVPRGPLTHRAR